MDKINSLVKDQKNILKNQDLDNFGNLLHES